ncbi:hypothetical protein ALC56_04771, partial [Trachymyrmex septentrionalis]
KNTCLCILSYDSAITARIPSKDGPLAAQSLEDPDPYSLPTRAIKDIVRGPALPINLFTRRMLANVPRAITASFPLREPEDDFTSYPVAVSQSQSLQCQQWHRLLLGAETLNNSPEYSDGLCLQIKGDASSDSAGLIAAIADLVAKLEPKSGSPIISLQNDNKQCIILRKEPVVGAIYKDISI